MAQLNKELYKEFIICYLENVIKLLKTKKDAAEKEFATFSQKGTFNYDKATKAQLQAFGCSERIEELKIMLQSLNEDVIEKFYSRMGN